MSFWWSLLPTLLPQDFEFGFCLEIEFFYSWFLISFSQIIKNVSTRFIWVMQLRIVIYTLFTYQLRVKQDQRNKEQNKTPLHPKCANICTIYDVTRFKSGFRSWNLNTIVKLVRQICGGKPSFCRFGWPIIEDIFPI